MLEHRVYTLDKWDAEGKKSVLLSRRPSYPNLRKGLKKFKGPSKSVLLSGRPTYPVYYYLSRVYCS